MKTNIHKLPQRVLDVIAGCNPDFPRPSKDIIHVTDLLKPAYAWNLYVDKYDEIVTDWSDQLVTAQGGSLHETYQMYLNGYGWECEMSFEKEIEGVKLTGTCDAFDLNTGTLVSLKQTSVWGPTYKIADYTKQENCYRWFLNKEGKGVEKIYVDIWYRNWQLKQAGWSANYPKVPYECIELEVWPVTKTEQYIKDQIHYLTMCKDECSMEDKWQKYSVMKNKNKTSSRNCNTREECEIWITKYEKENPKKKDKFKVVLTEPTNCLSYCSARSVCPYALSLRSK